MMVDQEIVAEFQRDSDDDSDEEDIVRVRKPTMEIMEF
jgi:hypothetical protein